MVLPQNSPGAAPRSAAGVGGAAILLLGWVACGAPGEAPRPRPSASSGRVELGALPEHKREALSAWRAGEESWLARRAELVADPDVAAFLVDNLVVVLVRSYDAGQLPREGPPRLPFERARAELVRLGEHSAPVLAELLVVGDGVVAYLAGDVLGRLPGPLAAPAVAERLGVSRAEGRRRAAEVLGELPDGGAGERAVREGLAALLLADPEWIVRAQAARALAARGQRAPDAGGTAALRDVLTRGLEDGDPTVRASAAVGLAELGDRRAVPALVQRLARALRGEAQAAELRVLQSTLRSLTGVQRDLTPGGWRRWMDEHAALLAD